MSKRLLVIVPALALSVAVWLLASHPRRASTPPSSLLSVSLSRSGPPPHPRVPAPPAAPRASATSPWRTTSTETKSADGRAYDAGRRQILQQLERDPVGAAVPMVFNASKPQQLETLRWLKTVPEDKVVAIIPDLATRRDLSLVARKQAALDTIDGLIERLEREGVAAPVPAPGAVAAWIGRARADHGE